MHPTDRADAAFDLPHREDLALSELDEQSHWSELFFYNQYDWNDPAFKKLNRGKNAYEPVRLTQGYFMMVRRALLRLATTFPDGKPKRWHAKVQRDQRGNIVKVYACRRGRSNEPKDVYAHTELKGCIYKPGVVDHKNGWGLDNHDLNNLSHVNHGQNSSNAKRIRTKNLGLPPGVELITKGPKKGRYRGIRCKRLGKRRVLVTRSKLTWATPEPAAHWYQNQLKKLYAGRKEWAHNPKSVHFPLFPPRKEGWDAELELLNNAEDPEYEGRVDAMIDTLVREHLAGQDEDVPF